MFAPAAVEFQRNVCNVLHAKGMGGMKQAPEVPAQNPCR